MITLPRHAELWLPGWLAARRRLHAHRFDPSQPVTVWLMVADHYEPYWGKPDPALALARVQRWADRWPALAAEIPDDFGRPACWTWFYPAEDDDARVIEPLAEMTRRGLGDVEVHLHHDGEGEAWFVETVGRFVEQLRVRHGVGHRIDGGDAFGFVHGNWALDNARPDGRWCGLDHEITLLRRLGCYGDFTNPAAPDPCQTRLVNAVYWAVDDPAASRSHDTGTLVVPGATPPTDGFLCVQGPLTLRAHPRWRVLPSLEVGEVAGYARPTLGRARHWLDASPRIGNTVICKLFSHGAPERNGIPLIERGWAGEAFRHVRAEAHRRGWRVAWGSAWDVSRAILAAREGRSTDPNKLPLTP